MKAINDLIVNVGTAVLVIVASSLIFGPHPDAFHLEVPDRLRAIFFSITVIIAFSNVTGFPTRLLSQHWEEPGFGEAFFPWEGMKNKDRRVLAGSIESLAILLTLMGYPGLRALGYAIIMVMYGRGALVNAHIQLQAMLFAGIVCFISGLLLKDELYIVN